MNNDDEGVEQAQDIYMDYLAELESNEGDVTRLNREKNWACATSWLIVPAPWCCWRTRELHNTIRIRDSYKEAIQFWESINEKWLDIIGARGVETVVEDYCNCSFYIYGYSFNWDFMGTCEDSYFSGSKSCNSYKKITIGKTFEKASDGVVLTESAMDFPGTSHADKTRIELKNSSHMQMRNNDAFRIGLNNLLDGKNGKFFITDKKD